MKKITKTQLQEMIHEGVQKLFVKDLITESVVTSPYVLKIIDGYLEAMLFTEEEGELNNLTLDDISDYTKIDAYQDVLSFIKNAKSFLGNMEPSQIGHDLWLTRNRYGVGFWDRGFGEAGEELTRISEKMGEKHAFMSDEGKIEIE